MRRIVLFILTLFLAWGMIACSGRPKTEEIPLTKKSADSIQAMDTTKVAAYYFHFTARCVTCLAIEEQTKADIESLYPGKVTFTSVNLDDASSKPLAGKLQIAGQTLLLVKGSTKINLTTDGFMYARTEPEKFKSILKEKIDGLIK